MSTAGALVTSSDRWAREGAWRFDRVGPVGGAESCFGLLLVIEAGRTTLDRLATALGRSPAALDDLLAEARGGLLPRVNFHKARNHPTPPNSRERPPNGESPAAARHAGSAVAHPFPEDTRHGHQSGYRAAADA